MDAKIQEIREAHAREDNMLLKYPTSSTRKAHEYIGYLLQQIEIKDKDSAQHKEDELRMIQEVRGVRHSAEHRLKRIRELKRENIKLKEALEFYEDVQNYLTDVGDVGEHYPQSVLIDKGERARAALKGEDTHE
ncbi:cell shape-determining protein MreC [Paenibacillus sp. 1182]|uniref:hypothetical protein n=1 Tax=Paenibacillus sp. 1182 TaxID=2806565 RepID=UPI001AE67073|nr:hypothetical protein [Paenibacillus sp. 1182]MBP1309091.1 cell shape-determining protein MreC [Paenibacillus sp. 1182]